MNVTRDLSVLDGVTRNPVTGTVAYQVVPGREADFHSWGWALLRATAQQPGFLGGGVLVDGEADWHVIYRFGGEDSVRAWENSLARAQWAARAEELARETGRRSVHGSRIWFDSQEPRKHSPPAPGPPAKWKLWFVMPRLQRFFKKWLYPPLQALRGRHKRRTA
ncbi:hypothetical protein [Streptomyces sp. NPDC093984]|uniref:hypothetical protein n=1 Tax=Streptomyces sp. NPDC093984 TaxID=3366052 RepID=UPI00381036E1